MPNNGYAVLIRPRGQGGPASLTDVIQDWRDRFNESLGGTNPEYLDGNPELFDLTLSKLRLFGGSEIHLPKGCVTVIVGPNNAGKSTLLREVVNAISHHPGNPTTPSLVLQDMELIKSGSVKDAMAWIGDHSTFISTPQLTAFRTVRGAVLYPANVAHNWSHPGTSLGETAQIVLYYSHAADRFNFGGGIEMRDSFSDPAIDPIHELQDSRPLLAQLSEISAKVFEQPLTLDTLGRIIQLRAGTINVPAPPIDNISAEYRDAMAGIPLLSEQGDGIRSFMGQLLPLVTSSFKVIALDEPEAFLHPPQAQGLGQELGRYAAAGGVQVLIATHDRNLLAGLLDSGVDVSVVRMRRDGTSTMARQLEAQKVAKLWQDPALKYTNVLDGLFHRAVVLTEGQSDCGYLGAAIDVGTSKEITSHDLLFIPTGGKAGIPRVAKSLAAVGVPIVAAADIDLLSDINMVKSVVESIGGAWTTDLQTLWERATKTIRSKKEPAKVRDVRAGIESVLSGIDDEPFTEEVKEKIRAQIRTQGSKWGNMKQFGLAAFHGEERIALESLLDELDKIGVVLVSSGELESLAPRVPVRKGPEWLPAALSADAHQNSETQAHVARISEAAQRRSANLGSPPTPA